MEDLSKLDRYIIEQVMPFIQAVRNLNPDNLYKAEALCCQFWHRTKPVKHSWIGRRLYQLAISDHLPLEPVRKDSDKAMLYRLT
jgi:hypothetical protein